ncbi:MAG: hypothetical protein R6V86_13040 [Spirochaetia bacterium]
MKRLAKLWIAAGGVFVLVLSGTVFPELAAGESAAGESAAEVPPIGVVSPGWLPWSMNVSSQAPRGSGLDQAEYDQLRRKMEELGAFFRRTPYLRSPSGVEIVPTLTILNRVGTATGRLGLNITRDTLLPERHPLKDGTGWKGAKGPVRADLRLSLYRPEYHRRNPRSSLRIQINDPWMEGRWVFQDNEGGVYRAWPLLEEQKGRGGRPDLLRYQLDGGVVLEKLLPPGRLPWLPVSQERWIRLLINRSKGDLEDYRSQITSGAEDRRAKTMQSYEIMKSHNAESAERLLADFEKTEERYAQIAAAIAAEEYDTLEALGDRGRAMLGRHMQELEAELAGLSPDERAAPAYGFEFPPAMYWMPRRPPQRPSLLLDPDDPAGSALVTPNPEFFRTDLPAGAVQSITIVNGLWEEFARRLEHELDYEGLAGMVHIGNVKPEN